MVAHWGTGQERAWGQRGHDLGEVERHLFRLQLIARADTRHVAVVPPTGEVALEVSGEAAKTTVGDDAFDPFVENRNKHAVVPAQGMANGANALRIDLRQRLQQIDGPHVVPD